MARNKMKSSHLWELFILCVFREVDEKGGSNAESADEALSRGRGNFRATARKLSVTESHC